MVDFTAYLSTPVGNLVVKALPEGHYYGRVKSYEPKESSKGKPMLNWKFVLDSAADDVDTSQLPEAGVSGKTVNYNCMMDNEFGLADIGNVIKACKIETDPAQGFGTYLPQTKEQPVKLFITQRPRDKDDPASEMTDEVKKVLPVD